MMHGSVRGMPPRVTGQDAQRRAVLLINATSGSASAQEVDQQLVQILEDRGGMDVHLQRLEGDALVQQLQTLTRDDPEVLPIIGGGDGTIRAAAQVMLDSGRPWGVLPLGTYNHFAQDLGLDNDPLQAAEQLATSEVRAVDAGIVNGRVFVNNASLGAYPLAVAIRDMLRSSMGLPKQLAMAYAFWKLFWRYRLLTIRLEAEEERNIDLLHAPFLLISNNLYEKKSLTAVGRARLDEGVLGLYCLSQETRWGFLKAMFHGLIHALRENEALVMKRTRHVSVHLQRGRVAAGLDGEVFQIETPLHFESRPAALHLLAPPVRGHDR